LTSATSVEVAGRDVDDAGSSVSITSSVAVEVLVAVSVGAGVLDGVNVGSGSFVGVKVDLVWKGVLVEVPLRVYLGDDCTASQALLMLVSKRINNKTFPYLFCIIYLLIINELPASYASSRASHA
jgi:hypothetical protein